MKSGGNGERAPLRTVLQNFLNHVETLERRRNGADDQYDKEFQELKVLSESLKGQPAYSCREGEKEVNRRKNRYKDILPFDCTRVSLSEIVGIPGSDYINANYIRGASGSQAYIASQGPLVHTVTDFWRMVVECDVQVIVMACNEEESGKHKCECYWSESDAEPKAYGPYAVKLLKSRRMCNDFNLRTMELTYVNASGESVTRTVVQFHYWAWPDHGVPALVRPLLDMVRLIRDCQASETLPLLIHCSAGCGRTGTICAIDYVWGLLRAGKLTEDFSLFELIADMRRQRVAMVQTKDQYILVHRALRELFIEQLKMIDAHPYENLDVNGHPLICPPQEVRIDPSYETIFVKVNAGDVLEVNEEDDVCLEEPMDQIPWPVLQYHQSSSLDSINCSDQLGSLAPPLPDKKRRNSSSASGHGSPVSPKGGYDNVSDVSSKESSPPASLERTLLACKATPVDSEPVGENLKEAELVTPKSSGLVRKSSILKIRAFFEKSPSEPRASSGSNEKTSKSSKSPSSSTTRKASSFRLREAPTRFYRSLEPQEDPGPKPSTELSSSASQPAKLSLLAVPGGSDAACGKSALLEDSKPSLPVKRSKSMKVYRSFQDVLQQGGAPKEKAVVVAQAVIPTPPPPPCPSPPVPCDVVVLSKTPSITYITNNNNNIGPSVTKESLPSSVPLATSSLDRVREQRLTSAKSSSAFSASTGPVVGGSLDRSVVVQSKAIPTYVNVLMRNQEVAGGLTRKPSRLDNDTRQLLKDCQAYLMTDDDVPPPEEAGDKKIQRRAAKDLLQASSSSKQERRHSFKHAVGPDELDDATDATIVDPVADLRLDGSEPKGCDEVDEVEPKPNRKKAHEYEAIWLGGQASAQSPPPSPLEGSGDIGRDPSGNSSAKESVFVQKSDEIRLLLTELRNPPREEPSKQQSLSVSPRPGITIGPVSPRLHPDRVLSELQELVERANRSKEEAIQSEVVLQMNASSSASPSGGRNSLSPAQYSSSNQTTTAMGGTIPAPPASMSSTPSPGLISPIPIKVTAIPANNPSTSAASSSFYKNPAGQPSTTVAVPAAEPKAPAFRPPPPYPAKLYVKLPPVANDEKKPTTTTTFPSSLPEPQTPPALTASSSPRVQRRLPPEYKAPPPVQRPSVLAVTAKPPPPQQQQQQSLPVPQPIAPPRSKRQTATHLTPAIAFPKGPPIPARSFVPPSAPPGIDLDAVAAVMAASAETSSRATSGLTNNNSSSSGSSSPTTAANKALSKALGKFHATAASFKTKLATQFGDSSRTAGASGGDADSSSSSSSSSPSAAGQQPARMERESSFVKPTVVYVGDGVTVVSTSEATSYVRKKQQYL